MTLSLRKIEEAARSADELTMSMFANAKDLNKEVSRRYAALANELPPATVLALVAVVRAAKESIDYHTRLAKICRTELSPDDAELREALAPFEE